MSAAKARRKPKKGPTQTGWQLSPTTWRAMWRVIGWSVALASVGVGLHYLRQHIVRTQPVASAEIEWVNLPAWLDQPESHDTLERITYAADLHVDDDLRDPNLCERVAAGLENSPWVASVERVSKQPDGLVRIAATYREPFAFVESGGVAYLVDRNGVRLPGKKHVDYVLDRFWNDWLRIVGVDGPIPRPGEQWQGDDLMAGLGLIEFLQEARSRGEVPFRTSLRAVDVSNWERRENAFSGELGLRTISPRGYIEWGLPPGSEYNIESSAARKLEMLRALYAERGHLPEAVLDVRGADAIKIHPPRNM